MPDQTEENPNFIAGYPKYLVDEWLVKEEGKFTDIYDFADVCWEIKAISLRNAVDMPAYEFRLFVDKLYCECKYLDNIYMFVGSLKVINDFCFKNEVCFNGNQRDSHYFYMGYLHESGNNTVKKLHGYVKGLLEEFIASKKELNNISVEQKCFYEKYLHKSQIDISWRYQSRFGLTEYQQQVNNDVKIKESVMAAHLNSCLNKEIAYQSWIDKEFIKNDSNRHRKQLSQFFGLIKYKQEHISLLLDKGIVTLTDMVTNKKEYVNSLMKLTNVSTINFLHKEPQVWRYIKNLDNKDIDKFFLLLANDLVKEMVQLDIKVLKKVKELTTRDLAKIVAALNKDVLLSFLSGNKNVLLLIAMQDAQNILAVLELLSDLSTQQWLFNILQNKYLLDCINAKELDFYRVLLIKGKVSLLYTDVVYIKIVALIGNSNIKETMLSFIISKVCHALPYEFRLCMDKLYGFCCDNFQEKDTKELLRLLPIFKRANSFLFANQDYLNADDFLFMELQNSFDCSTEVLQNILRESLNKYKAKLDKKIKSNKVSDFCLCGENSEISWRELCVGKHIADHAKIDMLLAADVIKELFAQNLLSFAFVQENMPKIESVLALLFRESKVVAMLRAATVTIGDILVFSEDVLRIDDMYNNTDIKYLVDQQLLSLAEVVACSKCSSKQAQLDNVARLKELYTVEQVKYLVAVGFASLFDLYVLPQDIFIILLNLTINNENFKLLIREKVLRFSDMLKYDKLFISDPVTALSRECDTIKLAELAVLPNILPMLTNKSISLSWIYAQELAVVEYINKVLYNKNIARLLKADISIVLHAISATKQKYSVHVCRNIVIELGSISVDFNVLANVREFLVLYRSKFNAAKFVDLLFLRDLLYVLTNTNLWFLLEKSAISIYDLVLVLDYGINYPMISKLLKLCCSAQVFVHIQSKSLSLREAKDLLANSKIEKFNKIFAVLSQPNMLKFVKTQMFSLFYLFEQVEKLFYCMGETRFNDIANIANMLDCASMNLGLKDLFLRIDEFLSAFSREDFLELINLLQIKSVQLLINKEILSFIDVKKLANTLGIDIFKEIAAYLFDEWKNALQYELFCIKKHKIKAIFAQLAIIKTNNTYDTKAAVAKLKTMSLNKVVSLCKYDDLLTILVCKPNTRKATL